MKFRNEVQLALSPDNVFAVLADVERVAPCLPGARLVGREGDEYRGAMRVKVGPVVVNYAGTLVFEDLDTQARRAILHARGEGDAGQGSAEATIINSVEADGEGSRIVVETDLQVRGRLAQFGTGPLDKISKRMFAEFVKNLEAMMTGETAGDATPLPKGRRSDGSDEPEPVPTSSTKAGAAEAEALDALGLLSDLTPAWVRGAALPAAWGLVLGFLLGRLRLRSR